MFIGNKAQQDASFELQILNRLDQMDQRIEKMSKPSIAGGVLASFLSAGSDVNGTLTVGDATVSGALCFVGIAAGGMASVALSVSNAQWISPALPFQAGTVIGFTVCCFRLIYDGVLYDFLSNRVPKEEKPEKPKPAARPVPLYHSEHQPPEVEVSCLLPNGQEIALSDLRNFLQTAAALYDRWDTKAWAREAWTEGHIDGYPPLGNFKTRVWAGVRELCTTWATQYPAFTDKAGRSMVWHTNDRILVEDFADMVEQIAKGDK